MSRPTSAVVPLFSELRKRIAQAYRLRTQSVRLKLAVLSPVLLLAFGTAVSAITVWHDSAYAHRGVVGRSERLLSPRELERKSDPAHPIKTAREVEAKKRLGISHFDGFKAFAKERTDQLLEKQKSPFARLLRAPSFVRQKQSAYLRIFVATSYGKLDEEIIVFVARLTRSGELESTEVRMSSSGDATLQDAYLKAFGSKLDSAQQAELVDDFQRTGVDVDASLFHEPQVYSDRIGPRDPPLRLSPILVLPLNREVTHMVRWRTPRELFDGGTWPLYLIKSDRDGRNFAYIVAKPPAVLTIPPPYRYITHLNTLESVPFKREDVSVVLLEGNTDARRELLQASGDKALNIAADLTAGSTFGTAETAQLEKQFRLRSGKTIAVVGHFENDKFIARRGTLELGSVSKDTLLEWGRRYDVSVLLLGCNTATRLDAPDATVQTITQMNSLEVVRALVRAGSDSANWSDYFASLSSSDNPIVLGNKTNLGDVHKGIFRKRLPDGRWFIIARMHYQFRCALFQKC